MNECILPKLPDNFTFPKRLFRLAKTLLDQPTELDEVAHRAQERMERSRSNLQEIWNDLKTMIRMVRAWTSGNYRKVPRKSIAKIVFSILYFLLLVDMIPDFIPAVGLLDDVSIFLWTIKSIRDDVDAFRKWEEHPEP